MKLKNYIEEAEKKAGTQKKLANYLEISAGYIRNIKACKSGLPDALCIKLADYIGADRLEVIAASNLVTEKDEGKRKIFESCFRGASRAASLLVAMVLVAVISIVTPSPANAQPEPVSIVTEFVLCKIRRVMKRLAKFLSSIPNSAGNFFRNEGFAG